MITTAERLQEQGSNQQVFDEKRYPHLSKYATLMRYPDRPVVGRDHEIRRLLASLNRAELSNAFLLGDAGSGKTMLVQGTAAQDTSRIYVEVDLAKMAASEEGEDGAVQMASRVKGLFDEAMFYKDDIERDYGDNPNMPDKTELVMFIDEFHLLIQLSAAAAQAIKPVLAESGRRGIKIIAATTFAEFHEFVEQDQALMQRLQRINIREPNEEVVVSILKSVAESHGVAELIYDPNLYSLIYEYSNRYVPADSQPRKSILMLDSMIGWYRTFPDDYKMDKHLLADVIHDSSGVQVNFEVNGREIERKLNERVYAQKFAARALEQRLQIAVADLHDKSRPISSFLFTGSTGTGKTEMAKSLAELLFGSERAMIRFDMSEYALENSLDRFREELTNRVWNQSHSIILFDEVEKANPVITRLMLQVLDDGRLANKQGREISFLNTYIILTTNAASEVYEDTVHYSSSDDGDGMQKYNQVIRRALIEHESFAPEIINRMNAFVPFSSLSENTYEKIIFKKLSKMQDEVYRIHGIKVHIDKEVPGYLVHEKHDINTDSGGARGLVSRMDTEVISPLARYINLFPHVKEVLVNIKGELRYKNKTQLESKAKVCISTYNPKKRRRQLK